MAARNEVGISLTAKDLASREIERVGGSLRTMGGAAEEAGTKTNVMGRIAGGVFNGVLLGAGMYAFQGVRAGFGFVKDATLGFNNQMQQASIAFTTMLGSGEKAKVFLDNLKDFAAKTPFEFSDLLTASQRLLAMGFTAQEVIPDLTALGDAAAGLGATPETIDRITLALGQMKSAGTVHAQDMLQLVEAGIPAWDMLAKGIHKTTAETMDLASQGLIPADTAIKAITDGMEQRFGGMMDKQAHTFSGAMSTIHDVTQNVMSTAFKPLFNVIASGADQFATFIQTPTFQAWADSVASGLQKVIDLTGQFLGAIGHIIDGVQGLASGRLPLSGLLDQLIAFRQSVLDNISSAFARLVPMATEGLRNLAASLPGLLSKITPVILNFAKQWAEGAMAFIGNLIDTLSANWPAILDAIRGLFQSIFDWIINEGVPMAANALADFASHFLDWVFEVGPKLLDMINSLIGAVIQFVIDNGPILAGKLVEWGIAFVGWIATVAIPKLIANLPFILNALLLFLGSAGIKLIGKIGEVGEALIVKLIYWLDKMPGETAKWLGEVLMKVYVWALKMVGEAKDAAANFVAKVIEFVKELPFKVAGLLLDVIGNVVKFGANLLGKAVKIGGDFLSGFLKFYIELPGKVGGFLGDVIAAILKFGGDLIHGASTAAGNFVHGFIDGLASLPGKLFDTIRNAFANLHIDLGPFHISASGVSIDLPHIDLPHFATGAWNLPADMMAVVHKGEMIIPADIAARLRGETTSAPTTSAATPSIATSAAASPTAVVTIQNYYGPSSVRSSDDIRRISEEQAENIRLMGFAPVVRTGGSLG